MIRPISQDSLARSSAPAPPPPPPPPPRRASRRTTFRLPTFDNVEDVRTYRPGGHHPVNLDDVIGRRYRVINKLGSGGFALVWLARDLRDGRNVALKILRSDAPEHETKVLKYLRDAAPRIPITHLQETFTIRGPNGFHQCLVLDLAGPNLNFMAVYYTNRRPALSFLKTAARRLAEGLADLHAAGICHGDLTNTNVVFEIENIRNWTEEELRRHLGPPKTEPLLFLDGSPAPGFAPAHIVDTLDYSNLDIATLSPKLLMTDFGEAFFINDPPEELGTPAAFSAPELLFGYPPSSAADLWALGCLLFEIHTFGILLPVFWGISVEALEMSIETIGTLPEAWRGSYHKQDIDLEDKPGKKDPYFDDSIERTRLLDSQIRKELPSLSQPQQAALVQLLESLLVFEPSQRLSAREAGRHPWFTAEL